MSKPNPMTCGAKTRSGAPCKQPPIKGARRCRNHGGLTPRGPASPHFKNGKHSKYLYLPEQLRARTEELAGDAIENLEANIAIQKSLESQLLEKMGTGESPRAWEKLKEVLTNPDTDDYYKCSEARKIVAGALGQDSLIKQIQSVQESQRKQTETLTKCRKEIQETYTQEQWNQLMNVVHNSLKKAAEAAGDRSRDVLMVFDREVGSYVKPKEIEGL